MKSLSILYVWALVDYIVDMRVVWIHLEHDFGDIQILSFKL